MDVFLPKGFEPGLSRARPSLGQRTMTLCVVMGGVHYPVLRRWAGGFAASATDVPVLEGVVDLFNGTEHLGQCLITGSETDGDARVYKVKQAAAVDYAATAQSDLFLERGAR